MSAIRIKNLWEKYRIKFIVEGKVNWEEFWALEDVCFDINKGEVVGIIGQNGAGKTTLLRLLAGMLVPDRGKVEVEGKVTTIMELGAGFNPEFTGRENIIFNARVYGISDGIIKQKINEIIEFSNLGKFIDAPIKCYSQGMYMRLAFALAIFAEPDILLIDDILAVGDEEARLKCLEKIWDLKKDGKTIVLVSHDMGMIRKICDRAIYLKEGKVACIGYPEKIIPLYLDSLGDAKGIVALTKGHLRMMFNNGKLSVSYGDNILTKDNSMYVCMLMPDSNLWLNSFILEWSIKSISDETIIVEGSNKEINVTQIWFFEISENKIRCRVEIRGDIKSSRLDVFLIQDYSRWESLYRKEDFGAFNHKSSWQELFSNDSDSNLIGIKPTADKANLPFLLFEFEEMSRNFKLFNTGYEQEARAIHVPLSKDVSSFTINFFPNEDLFSAFIKRVKDQLIAKRQVEKERRLALHTISSCNLRLFADLETKSLRLYFKDKEITKGHGLHCSFLYNGDWYDLSSCDWQINKNNNSLMLKFSWQQPRFSQNWELSIVEECILWNVVFEYDKPHDFNYVKFGLAVVPEYQNFFCGYQQGNFLPEFKLWQDILLEDSKAELFGVNKSEDLPAVILENKAHFTCVVQNSDAKSSCRILQLAYIAPGLPIPNQPFFTKLVFSEKQKLIERYVQDEKQKVIIRQKKEQEDIRVTHTISSGNLRLFADLETKSLRLYFKDKEITKGHGLHAVFDTSQGPFISENTQWRIDKRSENEMVLVLDCQPLSLSQVWLLSCPQHDLLSIKVELRSDKELFLKEQFLRLQLKDGYANWLTSYEKGNFIIGNYINDVGPIRLKDSKVGQVILDSRDYNNFPRFSFKSIGYLDRTILSVYKSKFGDEPVINLGFSRIIPKGKMLLPVGSYEYFEGSIVLGEEVINMEQQVSSKEAEIKDKNTKFIFDRGKGKIFWKQKELTTGLSLYSSVRHNGIWHDSYQAVWEVNKIKDKYLEVCGDWPYIPISQVWQIQLVEGNLIHWKIEMDIYQAVNLEMMQANLMLSSEYQSWIFPKTNLQCVFPNEYTQEYDILPFRFWYGRPIESGFILMGNNLPELSFLTKLQDESIRGIIENTDYLYQARLLQYQKSSIDKLSPGKKIYFDGLIKISDHE